MRRWCWCAIHVVAIASCAHAPLESDYRSASDDDDITSDDDSEDDAYDDSESDDDDPPYDDADEDDEPAPDDESDAPYDDEDESDTPDPGAARDAGTGRDAGPRDQTTGRRDGGAPTSDASVRDDGAQDPASDPNARVDAGVRDAGLDAGTTAGRDAAAPNNAAPLDAGTAKPADAPVTPPDAGVLARKGCVPGTYRGVFEGDITALLGHVHIRISGDLLIDLTGAVGATQLEVRNGRLQGTDQSGNPIEARVTGRVDCRTLQLTGGLLSSGSYRRRDPIWGGPAVTIGFRGVATGTFFDDPASAIGRWEVVNERGTRSGSGTWTARIQN